jgi:AraC family transcriptional regulator, positive regulator of tynA and feaB
LGSAEAGAVSRAFDTFRRGWEAEFGAGIPLPAFSPATTSDFRVTSRAIRVDDAAITDLSGKSVIRTEGPLGSPEDVVRLYVVRRGACTLGSLPAAMLKPLLGGRTITGPTDRTGQCGGHALLR